MRDHGLGGLSDRISRDLSVEPGDSFSNLLRYLGALEFEVRLGSDATVRAIVLRLRDVVETEDHAPLTGVDLVLTGADREQYRVDRVRLGGSPELGAIADGLHALRVELLESREREQ
jgi:hypothetical protein